MSRSSAWPVLLRAEGIVFYGREGRTVVVKTFEEAQKIREQYPFRVSRSQMLSDSFQSGVMWMLYYFGLEPKSILKNCIYQRKLKKEVQNVSKQNH